jgi:hypothetical protein
LKLGCGPLCKVRNFFILKLNCHIDNYKYLLLRVEKKEQKNIKQIPKEKNDEMRAFLAK